MNFSGFEAYGWVFGRGILYTLSLSGVAIGIGILLTLMLYAAMTVRIPAIRLLVSGASEVVRLCPPLVVVIWLYYALPAFGFFAVPAEPAAAIALGLYFAVFGVDILRGTTASIPSPLWDTEVVHAKSRLHFYFNFVIPDLFRRTFPALNAQVVSTIKNSSLASVIAVPELTYTASLVATEVVRPFEVYSILALAYIVTLAPIVLILRWMETTSLVALEPGHDAHR